MGGISLIGDGELHDERMWCIIYRDPSMMVPWFLIAAYAYEIANYPVISDGAWDELCRRLHKEWKGLRHRHKGLIDRRELGSATAGYLTEDDYPGLVIGSAGLLIQEIKDGKKRISDERAEARRLRRRHRRVP